MLIAFTQECISKLKAWKAGMESKGLRVNMKKTKFMSPVLTWMSYRNQATIPVLSAARVSATTPLNAYSASYGSTRGAAASLVDW